MSYRADTYIFDRVPTTSLGLCSSDGSRMVVVPVGEASYAGVSISNADYDGVGWQNAILEVMQSVEHGGPWYPLGTPVTFNAPGMKPPIDVSGCAFLGIVVTTKENNPWHVKIGVVTKTER